MRDYDQYRGYDSESGRDWEDQRERSQDYGRNRWRSSDRNNDYQQRDHYNRQGQGWGSDQGMRNFGQSSGDNDRRERQESNWNRGNQSRWGQGSGSSWENDRGRYYGGSQGGWGGSSSYYRGPDEDERGMSGGYSGGSFGAQGSGSGDRYGITMGRYGTRGGYGGASYGGDYGSNTRYGGSSDWDRGYGSRDSNWGSSRQNWGTGRSSWDRNRDDERNWFEKAGDKISSWFSDDDDERNRGYRGRGPKGYKRSDDRIKEDINDRLTDDPMLDASDIEIEVKEGEVTLSGKVEHRRAKRYAEDIVESIPGVRDVENKIKVKDRESDSSMFGTSRSTKPTTSMGRSDEGNERTGRTTSGSKATTTGATSAS